jgi:hypothetical protein
MNTMQKFWEAAMRQSDGESGAATPEAPAAAETPVVADAAQDTAVAGEALGNDESITAESSAKPPQGLLDRIGQLTRQKRELEERLQQAEYYQQQQYAPQQQPAGEVPYDPRQIQLEVHRQAQELAKQQQWKDTTDKIWNDGLGKYGDWAPQLNNMAQILGGIPTTLTEAAIETGNPQDVLYHLAKNPDEAARIAMLPPTRQAVAVAKLAQGLNAPKRVSSAPPPITPKVQGIGAAPATLDDPDISMEEWARLRNASTSRRRR